jgi:hypothetical protein
MLRWLADPPPITRLAFGAALLDPVEDKLTGYRRLSEFLPAVQIDAEGSEDFFYQINRPRKSNLPIKGLRINRLSKWSVALIQSFRLTMIPTSPVGVQNFPGDKCHVCRVELDISTPADFQDELPREKLADIFRELAELGSEISLRGDIR